VGLTGQRKGGNRPRAAPASFPVRTGRRIEDYPLRAPDGALS
jgi:hypothetical protein